MIMTVYLLLIFLFVVNAQSRVIMSYLVESYATDDTLYPRDIQMRAMVEKALQFDLGTLYRRFSAYFVCFKSNVALYVYFNIYT